MTDRLPSYARHKIHPLVRRWTRAETLETNLREELRSDLERLHSDALATESQHHCPVAGAGAEDYKNRLLNVSGLELLTGVRFLDGDMAQRFVDVIYSSEPDLTPEQVDLINGAIHREFVVLQPQRTRFYIPIHQPRFSEDGEQRLIAAPLGVMLAQPQLETFSRVSLQQAASLTFYPRPTSTVSFTPTTGAAGGYQG